MRKILFPALLAVAVLLAPAVQAKPNLAAVVDTPCTYEQVMAAMSKVSPQAYGKFTGSPIAGGMLQNFLAAPRKQRIEMVRQFQQQPKMAKYLPVIVAVAKVCEQF